MRLIDQIPVDIISTPFQHVDHVHFHVVPKPNEKEGLILTLDDNWPQRKAEKEELAATLEKMKGRL